MLLFEPPDKAQRELVRAYHNCILNVTAWPCLAPVMAMEGPRASKEACRQFSEDVYGLTKMDNKGPNDLGKGFLDDWLLY